MHEFDLPLVEVRDNSVATNLDKKGALETQFRSNPEVICCRVFLDYLEDKINIIF